MQTGRPEAGERPRSWRGVEWLRRYGPAEAFALLSALVGYVALEAATGSHAAAAYGAAVGDNVGYYGVLLARQLRADARVARSYGARGLARTLRRLAIEFGPAEALDATLLRPALTALAVTAAGPALGVLLGKLAADLVFYVPVITTYERTKQSAVRPAAGE
jgi:hypothetical protein